MIQRRIDKIGTGDYHRGFLGEGHMAKAIIDGQDFSYTDPFIILMDDKLDLPGGAPVGGAHPHAGFETVTLVLKGDEKHFKTGSLELMTAGKGIVHTEEITSKTEMHILQLWLALPPEKRWVEPSWQLILKEEAPTLISGKSEIRLYSGSSNGMTSPLRNHTPFTLVDFKMEGAGTVTQNIPARYNGFIYVLEGNVEIGGTNVRSGHSGWLEHLTSDEETEIIFHAGAEGSHFVFYAAAPHGVEIVGHGPFIGDTNEDIMRLYAEYRAGKIPHLNDLPESLKVQHHRTGAIPG